MEDPARAWPAWKFGMKIDDLFTTLHDQYNTFSYTLQDPEAFHHDVYEISRDADTVDEFHRLMADRRQRRLRELNESLETTAVEIIANPKLMHTKQWQHALQLFRTKSYDSLVRYFASYIPHDYHLDHPDTPTTTTSSSSSSSSSFSETDTLSTAASCVDDASLPFLDDDFFAQGPVMTCEPDLIEDEDQHGHGIICKRSSSPPSEVAHSETSASSPPSDTDSIDFSTNPPSRSMSFCGSEAGVLVPDLVRLRHVEASCETSQCDDSDTAITSACDEVESQFAVDEADESPILARNDGASVLDEDLDGDVFEEHDFSHTQSPVDDVDHVEFVSHSGMHDTLDVDTPAPRPEASYSLLQCILSKKAPLSTCRRSSSPKSPLESRRADSPWREVRRSPVELSSKIQKSVQDLARKRRTATKKD